MGSREEEQPLLVLGTGREHRFGGHDAELELGAGDAPKAGDLETQEEPADDIAAEAELFTVAVDYRYEVIGEEANQQRFAEVVHNAWSAATHWEDFMFSTDPETRSVSVLVSGVRATAPHAAGREVAEVLRSCLAGAELPEEFWWKRRLKVEVVPVADFDALLDERYGPPEQETQG